MRRIAPLLAAFSLLAIAGVPASAESVSLSGSGWRMSVAFPSGKGPFPAVIIMPGCGGNSPPAVAAGLRAHAGRLVRSGIAAGIIDVLGGGSICANLSALVSQEAAAARKATAAARALANNPRIAGSRIGFMGQSFGGSVALRLASASQRSGARAFAAIVAYYPWCADGYGGRGRTDFDVPVLILGGGADDWTPVARCKALGGGGIKPSIAVFPGAHHSFDLPGLPKQKIAGVGGSYTVAGNAGAAPASAGRYLGFFRSRLR
jgi:dienelactone hydrolase